MPSGRLAARSTAACRVASSFPLSSSFNSACLCSPANCSSLPAYAIFSSVSFAPSSVVICSVICPSALCCPLSCAAALSTLVRTGMLSKPNAFIRLALYLDFTVGFSAYLTISSIAACASAGLAKSSLGKPSFSFLLVSPSSFISCSVIRVFSPSMSSVNNSRCAPSLRSCSSFAIASSNASAYFSG